MIKKKQILWKQDNESKIDESNQNQLKLQNENITLKIEFESLKQRFNTIENDPSLKSVQNKFKSRNKSQNDRESLQFDQSSLVQYTNENSFDNKNGFFNLNEKEI